LNKDGGFERIINSRCLWGIVMGENLILILLGADSLRFGRDFCVLGEFDADWLIYW